MTTRTGIGFDVHRFARGRRLVLGGVNIPHSRGLDGHSDADVICHAVMDALLGAAAEGDIGRLFPNTDPQWKGADSLRLMSQVTKLLRRKGWRVGNVDAAVVAEAPRLAPYVDPMRQAMATVLKVGVDCVSVKATTAERLGALGRQEGMAVMAVATILKIPGRPRSKRRR
jgi:2-C-methyl-D-erythritol 2,4-cyclodiphosphate synthase